MEKGRKRRLGMVDPPNVGTLELEGRSIDLKRQKVGTSATLAIHNEATPITEWSPDDVWNYLSSMKLPKVASVFKGI